MLSSLIMLSPPSVCADSYAAPAAARPDQKLSRDCWPEPGRVAGVVFQSAVYRHSSAAAEARAAALGLSRAGLPVVLAPGDSPQDAAAPLPPAEQEALEALTHRKLDLARSVLYYQGDPAGWNLDYHGRARVGRAAPWSDRLPRSWQQPCQALDQLWVPSEFQRQIVLSAGLAPGKVRVLRAGIDTQQFRPGLPPLKIPPRRGFNFLAVTSLEDRKATELLLSAFLQEFSAEEDVSLTLKTWPRPPSPPGLAMDLAAELAWFVERIAGQPLEKCATVILLDQALPATLMPALYAAADAFVLPSRGEGRARALLEALSCQLPVISTAWGPALEFLDHENSFLVESEGLAEVPAAEEFLCGHCWAQPSLEQLRRQMRAVCAHPEAAGARARKGRERLVAAWDWSVLLPAWEEAFRRLLG